MNATISVICFKSKVLSNGESPLMLRVTKNRKRSMKSLGISIDPDLWNFDKNVPKPECPNKEEIESLILKTKIEYQQKLLHEKVKGNDFTAASIVNGDSSKPKSTSVDDFYSEVISMLKNSGKIGNSDVYKISYNSLRSFNKGKALSYNFAAIDIQFLERYKVWLINRGNKDQTIVNRFKTLRAVYNRAISSNIATKSQCPFEVFKLNKFNTKSIKRALGKEEIIRVINYSVESTSFFRTLAHSIFCFSYLCGGISFVDIANLKSDNIQNGRLVYKRQKTHGIINIPIVESAFGFINKYEAHRNCAGYLFPILDTNIHVSPTQKNDRVIKVRKRVNKELRMIGEELNISLKLTTYVARHSFATILKNSGVNVALISEALGHSELSTTQIYLDGFENIHFNEALKNLL